MTSLRWKLVLAFVLIGLISVALGLGYASLSTSGHFSRFVFDRNLEALRTQLSDHYRAQGSWEGLDPRGFGAPLPSDRDDTIPLRAPNLLTVSDAQGRVIVAGPGHRPGEVLPAAALAAGEALEVDGETVGWLLFPGDLFRETPGEVIFRLRTNAALFLGGLGATAAALLLGFLLARSLTRPLIDLRRAAEAIAGGAFDRRVELRARDELGALAEAFNHMGEALARAQHLRRQMTADIAHELRTPASIILGHLDALEEGALPPSAETLAVLRGEAERLARLIEDLGVLAHADAGELALERTPTALDEVLERALAAHQAQAAARGIHFALAVEGPLPALAVDAGRMEQVFGNLLANALRYAPDGGVIAVGAAPAAGTLRLWVRDSGPGIPPQEQERVFERFYRADPARRRQDGGAGLGLAIARSLVRAHGGDLRLDSAPGQGATFTVELPLTEAPAGRPGGDAPGRAPIRPPSPE